MANIINRLIINLTLKLITNIINRLIAISEIKLMVNIINRLIINLTLKLIINIVATRGLYEYLVKHFINVKKVEFLRLRS